MRKLTNKGLTRKLDDLIREVVRKRDLDWREQGNCITCSKSVTKETSDPGHYISRKNHSVRWNLKNVHIQCRYCNRFMYGKADEYALFLIGKYGQGILEELHKEKQKTLSYKDKEKILEELNIFILNPSNR